MIRIDLPWTKPPLTGNDRGHTRFRSPLVKQTLAEARRAVFEADLQPIVGANVTLHWLIPTKHRRDSDNLGPTLKECQDALVLEEILPDDSWVHIPRASCEIHPPNGQPAAMWLELTDITYYEEGIA